MILELKRWPSNEVCTIGKLSLPSGGYVYTLEDVEREEKIPGKTAIPKGCYEVKITWSNRFKKDLPLLIDVPGFEGVRVHSGNTDKDTEGCILVGLTKGVDCIGQSRDAMVIVMNQFSRVLAKEKLFINIT